MYSLKKFGFISLVLVIILGLFTACSSSSNTAQNSADKSDSKGKTITVGVEAGGPYTEFYKSIVKDFTAKTGINVKFLEIPHDNMHDRFITEATAGTGAIDVYQTDQPWISEFASKGFLEPLDSRISAADKKDFEPAALDAVSYEKKIYGLPYLVHTPIIYYRTDLFQQAGITEDPKTWEEFKADAKKLTNSSTGVYGTVIEGKQSGEPVTHLFDYILQAGGSVLNDKNKVTFDSPQVIDAFNYLLSMQYGDKSSPNGAVGYDNADVHNLFMQGKVAMAINWPYMYSMAQDPSQSKVSGKFAVAPQPADKNNASAVWSWGYGISSSSKNKDAAWEFVKWSTSTDVVSQLGKKFINPVARTSAFNQLKSDSSLKKEDLNAIKVMSDAAASGRSVTSTPKFPAIQNRLAISLSKILSKQSTPQEEVKAASKDIQDLISN